MIAPLLVAHAPWLYLHQHDVYPQFFHMDEKYYVDVLKDNLSLGCFQADALIAWLLVSKEGSDGVYIEDLAVLPEYQHQGIGRQLWIAALPSLPDKIHLEARTTSHDLFLRHHPGYALVLDRGAIDSEVDEYFWDMRWVKEKDNDQNGILDFFAVRLARLLSCCGLSR